MAKVNISLGTIKDKATDAVKNVDVNAIKNMATDAVKNVDVDALKDKAKKTTEIVTEKAVELKDVAISTKEDIDEKLTMLDRMLEQSITDYNDAYTIMNDRGIQLFVERTRSVDVISNVETLINSIANRPKSFDSDFEEINVSKKQFTGACEFADKEVMAAREAAGEAGAGLAAGATVAFMGPTAAMWVATTFGTASTGAAISTLSGAAATNAALAWLGGGAITAGGGGMAAGNAFLAMAGPIGWSIAGATLLTSIVLFAKKRTKLNKEKSDEIESVKRNTENVKEMSLNIKGILDETAMIRSGLNNSFADCLSLFAKDYSVMNDDEKMKLGALVNTTKALSKMFEKTIAMEEA